MITLNPYKIENMFHFKLEDYSSRSLFSKQLFTFEDKSKAIPILQANELDNFLSDTAKLVTHYANKYVVSAKPDKRELVKYIKKWGSPFLFNEQMLGSEDEYEDEMYFQCFQTACFHTELILNLWYEYNQNRLDILESAKSLTSLVHNTRTSMNNQAIHFALKTFFDPSKNLMIAFERRYPYSSGFWKFPDGTNAYNPFPYVKTFLPIEFSTTLKKVRELSSKLHDTEHCREFLKQMFLEAISENASQNEGSIVSHVFDKTIQIDYILYNNLLFFIKHSIDQSLRRCACGCDGDMAPRHTRYHDSQKCYQKFRDQNDPRRSLKETIRSRFKRAENGEGITWDQMDELYKEIDILYIKKHKTKEEIKSIINQKYNKFIASKKKGK